MQSAFFYNLTKNQYSSLAIRTTDTHKDQRYDKRAIRVVRTTERKIIITEVHEYVQKISGYKQIRTW